ncbi:hypothetical protein EJA05_22425 [Pseudomonas oryziphila]|uniref:Uncharacterized protein n=1 Tax=Pseudomonas entomophila TaxID=312306 RepID=A0A3Q8TX04_9PSED|nr:hypothetical protein EJA05_22425 [Pseudomonas oryziphila]
MMRGSIRRFSLVRSNPEIGIPPFAGKPAPTGTVTPVGAGLPAKRPALPPAEPMSCAIQKYCATTQTKQTTTSHKISQILFF